MTLLHEYKKGDLIRVTDPVYNKLHGKTFEVWKVSKHFVHVAERVTESDKVLVAFMPHYFGAKQIEKL